MPRSAFHLDTPDEEYERIRRKGQEFLARLRRHPAETDISDPTFEVPFEWIVHYGETYALSISEMVEALRLEHGITRSRQSISKRLVAAGYDTRPESHNRAKLIPWKLSTPRHRDQQLHRFLLTEARMRDEAWHLVDAFSAERHARARAQLQAKGHVVDYDPERGFFSTPRRPGVDLDFIREPDQD